jgi:hypothetical protein
MMMPAVAQVVEGRVWMPQGLIIDQWMPQHPCHSDDDLEALRLLWESAPQPPGRCQHDHLEWFTVPFDKDNAYREYFVSAANAKKPHDPHGMWAYNWLRTMCRSAQEAFHIPGPDSLYGIMLDRPDLYIQWHNAPDGYYLCIGCANCNCKTGHYQPQNQMGSLGWNPWHLTAGQLKQTLQLQHAFRAFFAEVLGEPHLCLGEMPLMIHPSPGIGPGLIEMAADQN